MRLVADAKYTDLFKGNLKSIRPRFRARSCYGKIGHASLAPKGEFIKHLVSLCLGVFFTVTALCQAPINGGVYVQQPGRWQRLYGAPVGSTRFDGGTGSKKIFTVYRDLHATTAVKGPRPVFSWSGFNDNISPRDVLIVRLAQKKDHRELQYATSNALSTTGYPPQDRVEVQVRDDGNVRTVTPQADLPPGEYMLFTDTPAALVAPDTRLTGSILAFDFQVIK